jgi:hypothetical protein
VETGKPLESTTRPAIHDAFCALDTNSLQGRGDGKRRPILKLRFPPDRSILLRDDGLTGLYHVEVVPPLHAGNFDQAFRRPHDATAYAVRLNRLLDLPVVARVGES